MIPDNNLSSPSSSAEAQARARITSNTDYLHSTSSKRTFFYIVIAAIIAVFIGGVFLFIGQPQKKSPDVDKTPDQTFIQDIEVQKEYQLPNGMYYSSATSPALKTPPNITFQYTTQASQPAQVSTAELYRLQNNLSQIQAEDIASRFGIYTKPAIIGQENYHFYDKKGRIDLVVYKRSGAFVATFLRNLYSTPSATAVIQTDQDAVNAAKTYLQKKNLWEEAFDLPMSNTFPKNQVVYRRTSQPNVSFVEFHRGWKTMPILSQVGFLNTTLKELQENPQSFLAKDMDVSYSSDGLQQLQRPNQFNTVLVGVKNDGTITYLQYYMRRFSATSRAHIKPYEQALEELKNGKGIGQLVYPVAVRADQRNTTGYTGQQWKELFPDNKAISKEAVVDEITLAYEEKLITESQSVMVPMYIFRGKAVLQNGTIVTFVSLVNAVK